MAHHRDAQDDLRTEAMSGKMAAIGNDEVKTTFQMFFYLTKKSKSYGAYVNLAFVYIGNPRPLFGWPFGTEP